MNCPNCHGQDFEIVEHGLRNSRTPFHAIRCARCSRFIGLTADPALRAEILELRETVRSLTVLVAEMRDGFLVPVA